MNKPTNHNKSEADLASNPLASKTTAAKTNVRLIKHPLVAELITNLRDSTTNSMLFRSYSRELTKMLIYEALSDLRLTERSVISQTGVQYQGAQVKDKVVFVGILRAGLGMLSTAMDAFPRGEFHVIGLKRNEVDPFAVEPVFYLDRLAEMSKQADRVIIVDPMLATGGSMLAALKALREKHNFAGTIQIISYIAALKGAEEIYKKYPDITIICAGFDQKLNKHAYTVPGLGDAGDRYFGIDSNLTSIQ